MLLNTDFDNAYVWWLVLEAAFASVASLSLHRMTMKAFPALADTGHSFRQLRKKYPEFTTKIKQLFFHKIGSFALYQISPFIIYAYTSLSIANQSKMSRTEEQAHTYRK